MRSSFASFNTGLLGMRASQYALDITGHNVVNIGTGGYTRQRIDQYSMSLNGSGSLESRIGQGVMVSGVSQLRNPYLDIRFRNEIAQVGHADSTLAGLNDLESILNEVGADAGIIKQFDAFSQALSKLASEPKNEQLQNSVRAAVDSLTKFMNQYAKKIEISQKETESNLTDTTIPEVNSLMEKIKNLNVSIERNQISGNPSLELMDQRNVLIDQLAQYVKIDVKYDSVKIPGTERTYERLRIDYLDNAGTRTPLVNGTQKPAKFSAERVPANTGDMQLHIRPMYTGNTEPPVDPTDLFATMDDSGIKGSLELLNCEGSFNTGAPSEPRGYGYYTKTMNTLALTMATAFNEANAQMVDAGGNPIGGDMFGSNVAGEPITAKNICVATGWADGSYGLVANRDNAATDNKADNLLFMESLLTSKKTIFLKEPGGNPNNSTEVAFNGTFRDCFTNMDGMLGTDIKTTEALLNNHLTVANSISDSIDSYSSVSLDEEGVNMMHFQKSLNASIRFMTTIDEALNTIINSMGIVGR